MAKTISKRLVFVVCAALVLNAVAAYASDSGMQWFVAVNDQNSGDARSGGEEKKKEPTPEEKMQARFPQPVEVGHLIGLPILDENDSTIGYMQQVVRTPGGKIQLIVPYAKRFGWVRSTSLLGWSRRLVAVPIEVVAILALQINALEMDRDAFDKAPTWEVKKGERIPPDQAIKIALGRR